MNRTIELGCINTLRLDRFTAPGAYLMSEDGSDVLLPNQYILDEMQLDDLLDVFIYTDSEDRLVATTAKPKAMLNEFGMFEVVDVAKFGAFVDWGLPKDLLVPKNRQKKPFKIGDKRFLRVVKDTQSERLIGVEKIGSYLSTNPKGYHQNREVKALIIASTPLGFKAIVDDKFEGMFFANEIFTEVVVSQTYKAFVKHVRSDGHFDLSMQKIGTVARASDDTESIMQKLEQNGGSLPYSSKSDATLISKNFFMSKKAFKRALVVLQQEGKIILKDSGIYRA